MGYASNRELKTPIYDVAVLAGALPAFVAQVSRFGMGAVKET
jgi:hypothetical protein